MALAVALLIVLPGGGNAASFMTGGLFGHV